MTQNAPRGRPSAFSSSSTDTHATSRLAWGISGFAVRVGINSGRAAVGMVGGANPQAIAFGEATYLASQLRGAAEPGTILVGDTTARRLAHRFALEPLGAIAVRGREAPVEVSRLIGSVTA